MSFEHHDRSFLRYRVAARLTALAAGALGLLGLVGWSADLPALLSLIPDRPVMPPSSALSLVLAGAALYLIAPAEPGHGHRRAGRVCAGIVLVLASATLVEYIARVRLGFDDVLLSILRDPGETRSAVAGVVTYPRAPGAAALVLLSAALLAFDRTERRRRPAEWLVFVAAVVVHLILTGHAYDAHLMFDHPAAAATATALPTAIALGLLAVGVLLARPERGVMAIVTSERLGGVTARRLLVPVIVGPPLLGLVVVWVQGNTIAALTLSHALLATATSTIACALLLLTAASLNRVDESRRSAHQAEQSLRVRVEALARAAAEIADAVARSGTDDDALLLLVVAQAQALTRARYAALGLGARLNPASAAATAGPTASSRRTT